MIKKIKRLRRGKKKENLYNIIVINSPKNLKGKIKDKLGFLNKCDYLWYKKNKYKIIRLNYNKLNYYLGLGYKLNKNLYFLIKWKNVLNKKKIKTN